MTGVQTCALPIFDSSMHPSHDSLVEVSPQIQAESLKLFVPLQSVAALEHVRVASLTIVCETSFNSFVARRRSGARAVNWDTSSK